MSGTHCGLERRAGPSGQSPMLQIGYAACWIYSVQRSSYLFWRPLQPFWDGLYPYDSPLSHQLVQWYVWYTTILRSILHVHRRRGVLLVAGIVRVQSGNFITLYEVEAGLSHCAVKPKISADLVRGVAKVDAMACDGFLDRQRKMGRHAAKTPTSTYRNIHSSQKQE